MSNISEAKVTIVTIIYGDRWKYLSQVVEAVMKDRHVHTFIIVDNGSKNSLEIKEGTKKYGDKIVIVRQEKNLGSAGGFAAGLSRARDTDCDFVLMLDDDSVPEDGAIDSYLENMKLFRDQKVVLSGSRHNVLANKDFFYQRPIVDDTPSGTFFEVFDLKKIAHFIKLLFMRRGSVAKRGPFIPIIPTEGFIYGGVFLPIEAVRNAPLPDASLFLYCDDVEYSWGVKNLGFKTYLCSSPRLNDVDFTFGENSSHIFGQFDQKTSSLRVYFRMRNMVRVSIKHTRQSKQVLFMSIFVWTLGLLILGLTKKGPIPVYFKRAKLIIEAVRAGYDKDREIPIEARPN